MSVGLYGCSPSLGGRFQVAANVRSDASVVLLSPQTFATRTTFDEPKVRRQLLLHCMSCYLVFV